LFLKTQTAIIKTILVRFPGKGNEPPLNVMKMKKKTLAWWFLAVGLLSLSLFYLALSHLFHKGYCGYQHTVMTAVHERPDQWNDICLGGKKPSQFFKGLAVNAGHAILFAQYSSYALLALLGLLTATSVHKRYRKS
jgi:hypothetical protein